MKQIRVSQNQWMQTDGIDAIQRLSGEGNASVVVFKTTVMKQEKNFRIDSKNGSPFDSHASLKSVVLANVQLSKQYQYHHLRENDATSLRETNESLAREVLKLKKKQEALQRERDKLHEIVANLGACFYVVDQSCKISYINHAALTLLGWKEEEVMGQSAHTLFHHTQADRSPSPPSDCFLREVLLQGTLVNLEEETFWHQDGRCIPVAMIAAPIVRNGEVGGVVVSFRNITRRKRIEEELSVARHKAEAVAKARSDFLSTMSHEIRTPMTGVLGMADLLLKTTMTEQQQHYVQTIHRAGRTLLRIINDILDLSKIQAGQLTLECLSFDLREVVADITEMFEERIHDKGLSFHCTLPDGAFKPLMGDPYRLSQILFNLMGNACKFTEEGSVSLAVERMEENERELLVRFRVTDTGIGMSAEFQNDLFQFFSQEAHSVSRKFGGTGLGLAITHRLVGMMQGEMGVESQSGHGSSFWFTIRFGKMLESDRLDLPEWKSDQRQSRLNHHTFKGRVLLVEDNLINQEVAEATLRQLGCQVTVASNGQRAMALLREIAPPFDLVLMDCEMPILDGFEATRQLREWEENTGAARLPVIALTAHVLEQSRQQCKEAGMDDYLRKPFSPADLVGVLKRWLHASFGDETEKNRLGSSEGLSQSGTESHPQAASMPDGGEHIRSDGDEFDEMSTPILDKLALEQILSLSQGGDYKLLHKMVEHFISWIPELILQLIQAVERRDVEGVRIAAHSLKSSCLIMGVKQLAEVGRAMELHYVDLELVGRHLPRIAPLFSDACQALKAYSNTYQASGAP